MPAAVIDGARANKAGRVGCDDAVHVPARGRDPSVQAAWASPSPLQALEKLLASRARSLDPRASDPSQCVRITPSDGRQRGTDGPRCRDLFDEPVVSGGHRAVASLERRYLVEKTKIAVKRRPATIKMEEVIETEKD